MRLVSARPVRRAPCRPLASDGLTILSCDPRLNVARFKKKKRKVKQSKRHGRLQYFEGELNTVKLALPLREGGKEGKNKMEVSGGCSNDELQAMLPGRSGNDRQQKKR